MGAPPYRRCIVCSRPGARVAVAGGFAHKPCADKCGMTRRGEGVVKKNVKKNAADRVDAILDGMRGKRDARDRDTRFAVGAVTGNGGRDFDVEPPPVAVLKPGSREAEMSLRPGDLVRLTHDAADYKPHDAIHIATRHGETTYVDVFPTGDRAPGSRPGPSWSMKRVGVSWAAPGEHDLCDAAAAEAGAAILDEIVRSAPVPMGVAPDFRAAFLAGCRYARARAAHDEAQRLAKGGGA